LSVQIVHGQVIGCRLSGFDGGVTYGHSRRSDLEGVFVDNGWPHLGVELSACSPLCQRV
jgi:hypothetical protein